MTLARLKTSHCRPARPAARDQVTQAQARKGISKEESPARGDWGVGGGRGTHPTPGARKKIAREIGSAPACARASWPRGGGRPRSERGARESLSHQGSSLLAPPLAAGTRITCIVNLEIVVSTQHARRSTPPGQRGRPVERERASATQQTTALAQGSASARAVRFLPGGAKGPRDWSGE